jgi:hypothetical protein
MEGSRQKSKGTLRTIEATKWPIRLTNKICETERRESLPSAASSVNVMKDLGTSNYQLDYESDVLTTTVIFFDLLFVVTRYRFCVPHPRCCPHHSGGDPTICQQSQLQAPDLFSGPTAGPVSGRHDNNDNIRPGFALLA